MEPALVGEEVDAAKAGGTGEELFTEEYETGDVGLKEYDYNYRDYNEPSPETAEVDGNIGPALSAVTDEGGVSRFASEAKTQKTFQPALQSIVKLHSVSRHVTCLSLHCRERLSYIKPYINSATDVLVANLLIWIQTLNIALRTGTEMILKHGVKKPQLSRLDASTIIHQTEFRVDDIHVKFVHSLRFIACKLSQSQRNGQRMHFKAKLSQQWLKWVLIYSVCIEPYSNLYCHICSIKRHSEVIFCPECRFEYMSLYFGAQLRGFCICA